MPMDATDTKLLKGIIAFSVLGLVIYFYPFSWPIESYQKQVQDLDQTREAIGQIKNDYETSFGAPPPRVWDPSADGADLILNPGRTTVEDRKNDYNQAIAALRTQIKNLQESSRMSFADWTVVPAEERNPGHYFTYKWDKLRLELGREARNAGVEIEDPDIGFKRFVETDSHTLTKARAEDMLRELHIAETVIRLAIKAKQEQETEERKKNLKPEAFMRIITVTPEDPVKTGPYRRERNEAYKPDITDPRDPRSRKFIIKELPKFIQEYPVEILLQCDVNSFMKFLRSVRTPGQFLVIRNLQIVSPSMADSQKDKDDLQKIVGENPMQQRDYKDQHIWARISAAGMDFFEPEAQKTASGKPVDEVPEMFRRPAKGQKVEPSGH